jgi:hypothetical protein
MADTDSLTQDRLKELLHYDVNTGVFIWAKGRRGCTKGAVAGGLDSHGYISIGIDGVKHMAHRLAWFYVYGYYPTEVDHENHARADNRLDNLRDANRVSNSKNISKPITNKSGVVGVSWSKRLGKRNDKWEVRASGKFLGYFDDFFEAVCTRRAAEVKYNFHPNHGK